VPRRPRCGAQAPRPRRASAETRIQVRRDTLDLDLATGAMLWIAPPGGGEGAGARIDSSETETGTYAMT
jgi:hypothetical protein